MACTRNFLVMQILCLSAGMYHSRNCSFKFKLCLTPGTVSLHVIFKFEGTIWWRGAFQVLCFYQCCYAPVHKEMESLVSIAGCYKVKIQSRIYRIFQSLSSLNRSLDCDVCMNVQRVFRFAMTCHTRLARRPETNNSKPTAIAVFSKTRCQTQETAFCISMMAPRCPVLDQIIDALLLTVTVIK
jgi:hypothetical protein